jgi:site-specific recombinase XerD
VVSGTRRKPGCLGPFVEGYRARLLALGHTPGTVRGQLRLLGQLGRWLSSEGIEPRQLNEGTVEAFLVSRREAGQQRVPTLRSFATLLGYLTDEGVIPTVVVEAATELEQLLLDYREWLVVDRGLAPPTVLRYEKLARRVLAQRVATNGNLLLAALTPADVVAFLLQESARVSVGATKGRVAELRSLAKFLFVKRLTPVSLADAVPPVAGWHDTGIPAGLTAADVQRLLDSCDRSDPGGLRDLAILTLVARLGLRCAEAARLKLDDIDWRAGEITVSGKARRRERLPLPVAVGEALAAYLAQARPATGLREVFVTLRAPINAIRPDLVSDVTRRACRRAGLPAVGAHRLRHALATQMLRRGATLVEVSQVLRHRDLATTAIYAKVDLDSLRQLAQPWPGAAQ